MIKCFRLLLSQFYLRRYTKAAAQGFADAHHALGLCYEKGKGVAINKEGQCKLNPVYARVKLIVGATGRPDLLEIEGLFTQG